MVGDFVGTALTRGGKLVLVVGNRVEENVFLFATVVLVGGGDTGGVLLYFTLADFLEVHDLPHLLIVKSL